MLLLFLALSCTLYQILSAYKAAGRLVNDWGGLLLCRERSCSRQDWVVLTDHGSSLENVGQLGMVSDLPRVRRNGESTLYHLDSDYAGIRLLVQLG